MQLRNDERLQTVISPSEKFSEKFAPKGEEFDNVETFPIVNSKHCQIEGWFRYDNSNDKFGTPSRNDILRDNYSRLNGFGSKHSKRVTPEKVNFEAASHWGKTRSGKKIPKRLTLTDPKLWNTKCFTEYLPTSFVQKKKRTKSNDRARYRIRVGA